MGFLKKLFGGGSDLDAVRRALASKRWAEVLAAGERIDRGQLDESTDDELDRMLAEAGDGLATFNLSEAQACLRSGEVERAIEHLDLAAQQVRSPGLAGRIADQRQGGGATIDSAPAQATDSASCCPTGCGSAAPGPQDAFGSEIGLDEQTHLDLILATYPTDIAERYEQASAVFKRAFLLSHENREEAARELLDELPEEQRDDLFYFERGALQGRMGETEAACSDLDEALQRNPKLSLALDALVRLLLQTGREEQAETRLRETLGEGRHAAFCCARLAEMATRRGEFGAALELATRSFEEGNREPEMALLTASLLEREGRLDEAESLLSRLGGGGCSGGGNIHLAEFWLRHRRNLDKALEAFKGAARQEPDEPRWPLRMAQVYLARGWRKDGESLLRKVLADPRLDEMLRSEGEAMLKGS